MFPIEIYGHSLIENCKSLQAIWLKILSVDALIPKMNNIIINLVLDWIGYKKRFIQVALVHDQRERENG